MDEALQKELEQFKCQKPVEAHSPSSLLEDNAKVSRKRKNVNIKKNQNAKYPIPPQIIAMQKKPAASDEVEEKSYHCKSKSLHGIMACIVDYLRDGFLSGDPSRMTPLSLDEILDRTQNLGISDADKRSLKNEALACNPRVDFIDDKLSYKPHYSLSDKKSLLRLLEMHNFHGLGGILLDDLRSSMVDADQVIVAVRNRISFITRSSDKKDVLFFHDPQYVLNIDDEMKSMWKGINVDSIDDAAMEQFLKKSNISYFEDAMGGNAESKEKSQKKASKAVKLLNTHLADGVLKDYE